MLEKYTEFAITYSCLSDKYYVIARKDDGMFYPLKESDLDNNKANIDESIDFARTKYFDTPEEAEIWCSLYGLRHCEEYDNI